MLNLFAASGHGNYAKNARLYLQQMEQVVSRTGKHWTSVPSDQSIEQSLNCNIKSPSGLTEGRGFTESVRNLWVLSVNQSSRVHNSLVEFCGITTDSQSDQNKELGETRRSKDLEHIDKFHNWFKTRNIFLVEDGNLYSLSTGLVSEIGKDDVNCEDAEEIGRLIQRTFDDSVVNACCIKRKDLLKPISSLLNTKTKTGKDKSITTDNEQALFIRLIAIADRVDSIETVFKHELTATPASLFKGSRMRKTPESTLLKVLLSNDGLSNSEDLEMCECTVVDGRALLHRVRWEKESQFAKVAVYYHEYICKNLKNPKIVFDGYGHSTTKDHEHLRAVARTEQSYFC